MPHDLLFGPELLDRLNLENFINSISWYDRLLTFSVWPVSDYSEALLMLTFESSFRNFSLEII